MAQREYKVRWEIEITADTPDEAAAVARAIQRDHDQQGTYFDVFDNENGAHFPVQLEPGSADPE